jgi:hypothetical protein
MRSSRAGPSDPDPIVAGIALRLTDATRVAEDNGAVNILRDAMKNKKTWLHFPAKYDIIEPGR